MENIRMEYYTAAWCGPCKAVRPIIEELQAAGWNIEKIDTDQNRDRASSANIMGVPTFIIYKNNVAVRRFTGARQKGAILSELNLAVDSI
jgi:thioredoxin 1